MDKVSSLTMRVLFIIAFGLLAISVSEALANAFGYTITRGSYSGGRLLEFAGILLMFVVALLLRQLRNQLKRDSGKAG